ncbi:hypothetical protein RBB78_17055 [Tunturiibacter empetritectus]|uniref:hypothetical protein n=1 Tax=Tunturiibacter empetritectus TaxID=3069691 RepID=UPI003D9B81D7
MYELMDVSAALGKAAPEVVERVPEVVVPVTQRLPEGSSAMARPMSPLEPR